MSPATPQPYVDPLVQGFDIESTINGRAYDVRIGLPASYQGGDLRYPMLVVLDAEILFGLTRDISTAEAMWSTAPRPNQAKVPEVIVVGISLPDGASNPLRRNFEYMPKTDPNDYSARTRQYIDDVSRALGAELRTGGAPEFLEVLVAEIIPRVQSHYRIDDSRRILSGVSASGTFCCYTLFVQPSAFTDYIIASPGLFGREIDRLESAWAGRHEDLNAGVFLAAGEGEISDPFQIFSGTARLTEELRGRNYPNLRLHYDFIPGASHVQTAAHSLARGLVKLFS
jgi:predicted alpha/beta superfamily hydrolase